MGITKSSDEGLVSGNFLVTDNGFAIVAADLTIPEWAVLCLFVPDFFKNRIF